MNYFQEYLVEEYKEDYVDGRLTRRDALKLIASVTGSLVLANSILAGCAPVGSQSETTVPAPATQPGAVMETPLPATGSPDLGAETPAAGSTRGQAAAGEDILFPGEGVDLMGYLARPDREGASPVVLVCHENRGLTDHIKDVTRRLAAAGYAALAVDLLSRQGGTASLSSDQVPGALSSSPPDQFVQDFRSGWQYLGSQAFADPSRVGMVGFCFGGGVTWLTATRMPELLAAVPFYGPHPPVEDVPNIQAAVLGIYGELDQRINAGIPAIEEAMRANNKIFEKVIYPGADHAFHNDTGSRYKADAAQDAWQRTLDWFATYLV